MGSSSNSAQKQADKNEKERQAAIARSTGEINTAFAGRQPDYDKLSADTTQFYTNDLNKQKGIADRTNRFALARSGLTGGSAQIDTTRRTGEDYLKGIVEAQRRGSAAGAGLRNADESTRMNLLAMAQTGLDATTAGSQATSALRGNLQSSMADATASGIGNLFGGATEAYKRSEDRKALQEGQKYAYNTIYKPSYGYGYGQ